MKLHTLHDANLKGKTVLLKVDYNVPLKTTQGRVSVVDDTRIKLSLPTINYLLDQNCKIIIVSHNGRPNGQVVKSLKLDPIARHLSQLLGHPVTKIDACVGPTVTQAVSALKPKQILMLENIRFHPGETTNDPKLAKFLSPLADAVVNDAFSASHRAHASVAGIAKHLPMIAGLHLEKEVKMLSHLLKNPKHPFIIIVGGAKVSDKVSVIEHLGKIADAVLVGGGVANNFLKAEGKKVYKSYLEDVVVDMGKQKLDSVQVAAKLLDQVRGKAMLLSGYIPLPKIIYPIDVIAATSISSKAKTLAVDLVKPEINGQLNPKLMYLDIGPNTIKLFREVILQAETVFWNGPMGVFEHAPFEAGTFEIATAVARSSALTILGGGDTITAINKFGLTDRYDYISAAGGATLEFLAGQKLPGITPMLIA